MEKPSWHYLLFAGVRSKDIVEALTEALSPLGDVSAIQLQKEMPKSGELAPTLDVTHLESLLSGKTAVIYIPDPPAWSETLDSLVRHDLKELTYALDAALREGLTDFIFISDMEGMGAAPRPVVIDESSLWSGQTNANDVQKYWYLCEQECRRAAEEGLNVLIIAAARMAVNDSFPRKHVYSTPVSQLVSAIKKSVTNRPSLQKLFVLEPLAENTLTINSSVPKWMFWKKPIPVNCVEVDDTLSKKYLSQA